MREAAQAPPTPIRPRAADAATALFERKFKLAEHLDCRGLLVELEVCDAELAEAFAAAEALGLKLSRAKAEAEEIATLATLGVDGKNDAERKEGRAKILRSDAAYRAALATVAGIEDERMNASARLEAIKRNAKRVDLTIQYRIGVLAFLAG